MILVPILFCAINTWSDLLFVENRGRYFDSSIQIMPKKSPPYSLAARDIAWICEGVAEREQAAAALSHVNGYQQFAKKNYYSEWDSDVFGLALLRESGFSCSEYIAGKNGSNWFKSRCADPTARPADYKMNYDGTLEQFISDNIGRNYCNSPVFNTGRFYDDPVISNEVIAVYNNLKNSTRFLSDNLSISTAGKKSDISSGTRSMGESPPFSWYKYGGYATLDKTKDDWEFGDRKVTYNLQNIFIPNVPNGSLVTVFVAASFVSDAHIYSKEGYETYTGPKYHGCYLLYEGEKVMPNHDPYNQGVSDCIFTPSDFRLGGAFEEFINRSSIKAYMDSVDVVTRMGTPEDKEAYGQGAEYIICPCAMIDFWCTDYKIIVMIDLGDHTKWW